MALVSGGRSTLNPNAPLFVPAAVRHVEDFSPQWWELITTLTWFRDYWLSQHQDEDSFCGGNDVDDVEGNSIADLLPDTIDLGVDEDLSYMEAEIEEFIQSTYTQEGSKFSPAAVKGLSENGLSKDSEALMRSLSLSKQRSPKYAAEPAKYREKPAKCVSPKSSLRRIQQPR